MITEADGGVYLDVHIQPGARRPGVVGRHGDRLKVAVAAPAEGGKANQAVIRTVAEMLDIPPNRVTLMSGSTSRRKRLFLRGIGADELRRRIEGR